MQFDLNETKGVLGVYCFGGTLGCYLAFFYYSMMEATLEHTIAAFVFAVIGGIFLIIGVIMLALNAQIMSKANNVRNPNLSPDTIARLLIVVTVIIIALLVVLSQVIST
jgi:NADH:ubiquinone oxidoreductase subunit 5 (subunit L)/multisubunit Na+/H+ antiporter MnhA subunit